MLGVRLSPLLLLAGCSRSGEAGTRALHELERLAFIPPARYSLESFPGPLSDCSLEKAIVFDQFEFTRGDLAYYWPDRQRLAYQLEWSESAAGSESERADWPAFLTFFEAEELAELRGMRLPRPMEWIHVAVGRRGFVVPWGGREGPLWANTRELGLGSPWRVGTFENGRSRPFGCYDLLGNVWEWVDGIVPGYEPAFEPDSFLEGDASVLGGAFDTPSRATFRQDSGRFHAKKEHKGTLSPSIGVRMCADAGPYLWRMAGSWGAGKGARERIRAVGSRWSQDALAREALCSLLAELRSRPLASQALDWLEEGARGER